MEPPASSPIVQVVTAPPPTTNNSDTPVPPEQFVMRGCSKPQLQKTSGNYRAMALDFLPQFKDFGKASAGTSAQFTTADTFYEHLHNQKRKVGGVFHTTGLEAEQSGASAFTDGEKHAYFDFRQYIDLSVTGPPFDVNYGKNLKCDGPANMLAAYATNRGIQAPKSKIDALKPKEKKKNSP